MKIVDTWWKFWLEQEWAWIVHVQFRIYFMEQKWTSGWGCMKDDLRAAFGSGMKMMFSSFIWWMERCGLGFHCSLKLPHYNLASNLTIVASLAANYWTLNCTRVAGFLVVAILMPNSSLSWASNQWWFQFRFTRQNATPLGRFTDASISNRWVHRQWMLPTQERSSLMQCVDTTSRIVLKLSKKICNHSHGWWFHTTHVSRLVGSMIVSNVLNLMALRLCLVFPFDETHMLGCF